MHAEVSRITRRIVERSKPTRERYLARMRVQAAQGPNRGNLSCSNLAHAIAPQPEQDRDLLLKSGPLNIAIVSAYNEMLSAHQPYHDYPEQLRRVLQPLGASVQFAGGVPAMCDGVTQGQPGMELSLFSREVIAQSTAIALSHAVFDGVLCLGICDKIVPGLLLGALSFGHLPCLFVPAGPMTSGASNARKAEVRQAYAEGRASREDLLAVEREAYHGPGTCTFYGTANSNQLLMEAMGLHLPGAAFANPDTPLRRALTGAAARRITELCSGAGEYTPLAGIVSEKTIVNGIVALLASGGSTNHAIHLPAIARAAGILIDWDDFAELSAVVPLLARVYPNGRADINHFDMAGGVGFLLRELVDGGLVHEDVSTVAGEGLRHYCVRAELAGESYVLCEAEAVSGDDTVLRPLPAPFRPSGGMERLTGNLGRAIFKTSALDPQHWQLQAPARIFSSQEALAQAFDDDDLDGDFVAVLPGQGPRACGMPELHKLTPLLASLQAKGQRVGLLTDGRMSGASGSVPAAIHCWPEAVAGGMIGRLQDGDPLLIDASGGRLDVLLDADELASRPPFDREAATHATGVGRELFAGYRAMASDAESGALAFLAPDQGSS